MIETLNEAIAAAKEWKPFSRPPPIEHLMSGKVLPESIEDKIAKAQAVKTLKDALEVAFKLAVEFGVPSDADIRRQFRKIIIQWAAENDPELLEWCRVSLKLRKALMLTWRFRRDSKNGEKFGEIADILSDELNKTENRYCPSEGVGKFWRWGLDD